jgi:hypothetical protein
MQRSSLCSMTLGKCSNWGRAWILANRASNNPQPSPCTAIRWFEPRAGSDEPVPRCGGPEGAWRHREQHTGGVRNLRDADVRAGKAPCFISLGLFLQHGRVSLAGASSLSALSGVSN